jgi:Arc/MetJ-type ribon-helix-helix transcriptional regulator
MAIKYTKAMTVKFPEEVWKAMEKRVKSKQKYYPRYSEADIVRTSVVKHLKEKGFLDEKKDYL